MVLFRLALKDRLVWTGSILGFMKTCGAALAQPLFLVALVVFVMANALWLFVISSQKLSIAYPLQISLVIVLNTLTSFFVFSEKISPQGIVGLVLVLAGIFLTVR